MRVPILWLAAAVAASVIGCSHDASPIAPSPPPPPPPVAASLELLVGPPISGSSDLLVTVTARDGAKHYLGGVEIGLTASSGTLEQSAVMTTLPLGQAQTWLRRATGDHVTVTAGTANGLTVTQTAATVAPSTPGPDDFTFGASKTSAATGEPVYFTLAPAGGAFAGTVRFGDGDSATVNLAGGSVTLSHRYERPGTVTAVATLRTPGGRTVSHSLMLTILAKTPAVVLLSIAPAGPTASDIVTLSATVSGGTGVRYAWDWTADGTVDLQTTAGSTTHLYAAGSYRARVTVTIDDATTVVAEAAFAVGQAAAPSVTLTATSVTVGSPTTFSASVSHGTPTGFTWNLGDASGPVTTSGGSLTYTYAAVGTYTATVDVALAEDGSIHAQTAVVVQDRPPLTLTVTASGSMQTGTATGLTATVTGGTPATFAWDFGDLSTVTNTSASLSHVYTSARTYTVTVTVTDALVRTAVGTTSVAILDPLTASLIVGALGTAGNPTTFNVTVSGGTATDAAWDFGDGSTLAHGSTTGLSHVYLTTGTYTATVTTTDSLGRTATGSVSVPIS